MRDGLLPRSLCLLLLAGSAAGSASVESRPPIDRETVVARHALRFESSGVDPTAHAAPKLMTPGMTLPS